jgi:hypothetical protein
MAKALKSFNPLAPTVAQSRSMLSIMLLARRKGNKLTVFAFALTLGMSKARLVSIVEGMQAQGWATIADNRITCNHAQAHKFTVRDGKVVAHGTPRNPAIVADNSARIRSSKGISECIRLLRVYTRMYPCE